MKQVSLPFMKVVFSHSLLGTTYDAFELPQGRLCPQSNISVDRSCRALS